MSSPTIPSPEELDRMRLFNEKVNKLRRSTFAREMATESTGVTVTWREGEAEPQAKIQGPQGEAVDAMILTPKSYLGKRAYLFNCMWEWLGDPDVGTYFWGGSVNSMNLLDQLIISRGLFYGEQGLKLDLDTVEILTPQVMTTSKGRPRKFDKRKKRGYSDHFPIQATIDTT